MSLLPRTRPSLARRWLAASLTSVLVLSVSACGGGDDPASGPKPQSTTSGAALRAYWPLTGLPVQNGLPSHPPVVVKIDNTEASEPQLGLGRADLITEELVEGGLTRLAVFFDTSIPPLVGPVRSMRASDIGLVKPVRGVVVTSGAAGQTIARLRAAKVTFESNDGGAKGFFRDSGRRAPYNLMMRLPELVSTLKRTATTAPYLQWDHRGASAAFAGTAPGSRLEATFGSGHTTRWAFEGSTYRNLNSNARPGTQFRPSTIIVVRVAVKDAGYTDPAGNFVPESVTTGTGNAVIFHGGKSLTGTWSKTRPAAGWTFKDTAGKAVRIPAGRTWIEVLPRNDAGGRLTSG